MAISNHDFIEIEYTGTLSDGKIFDTTSRSIAEQHGIFNPKMKYQPAIVCVGERQLLQGLDNDLIGKEIGKTNYITLQPEQAYGKRDIKKIRIVPAHTFTENKMRPYPGLQVDVDGEIGIISSIAGGRVIVNFNHPLAGKEVQYEYKILRKIENLDEKIVHYIHNVMRIPKETIKVAINGNTALIELPLQLPEPILNTLTLKLKETTGISNTQFSAKPLMKKSA